MKKPVVKSEKTAKAKKTKSVATSENKSSDKSLKKVVAKANSSGKACKVSSCKKEYRAKGYCKAHYKKWRQGTFGIARYKTCGSLDCRKPMLMNRHGYCEDHYQSYYVKGIEVARAAPAQKPAAEKKEATG